MPFVIKLIVAGLWLVAAFLCQHRSVGRQLFSYAAGIVALVHLGALAGGQFQQWAGGRQSVEGGVSLVGFLVGCVLGFGVGILAGAFAARNLGVYWAAQIVAVCFIVFLPLFRW